MDYDIREAFESIENDLIESMMRNFRRHRAEEDAEGYLWSQWQAEQLKSLEKYRKTNATKFNKQFSTINAKVAEMLETARADGNADQEVAILEAIQNGFKVPDLVPNSMTGEFFKLSDRKLDALIKATTDDLEKAETAILRRAEDQYRSAIFNAQVYANTGAGTYEKAVDMACRDLVRAGLSCVEYKNGAIHQLSDYAEMALRTANKRAYLYGEGEKRKEWGLSLVVVNSRQGGCSQCAEYIGKVYIDDVYSGGKESDGNYPLLSKAIEGGLFHPRCKDSTSTYYKGITTLKPVSKEEMAEMDRREKLEEQKGYYDNQAKKNQRIADYSLDKDNQRVFQFRADENAKKANEIGEKLSKSIEKYDSSGIINKEHSLKGKYSVPFGKIMGEKPISKRLAKEYSDEFDKASAIFGEITTISSVEVKSYEHNGIWGSFNDNSGVLISFGAGGDDGVAVLSKLASEMKKRGVWSTSSYLHPFRHELGHAIIKELSMNEQVYSEIIQKVNKFRNEIFEKISQYDYEKQVSKKADLLSVYGLDEIGEIDDFIAESIAEFLKGKPRHTARKVVNILLGKD